MTDNRRSAPLRTGRAIIAGLIGTVLMTALWLLEPWIGLPRLAVGQVLSHVIAVATATLSPGPAVGWTIHLCMGIVLALIYAAVFAPRAGGRPLVRGVLFGCAVFIVAQLVFAPLSGAGIFSRGDLALIAGSLLGHVVYGGVVGTIYGVPSRP